MRTPLTAPEIPQRGAGILVGIYTETTNKKRRRRHRYFFGQIPIPPVLRYQVSPNSSSALYKRKPPLSARHVTTPTSAIDNMMHLSTTTICRKAPNISNQSGIAYLVLKSQRPQHGQKTRAVLAKTPITCLALPTFFFFFFNIYCRVS